MAQSMLRLPSLSEVLGKDPQRKIKYYSVLSVKESYLPHIDDFKIQEEQTDFQGIDGVTKIVHDPYLTLYCYDLPERRACFVKTGADKDLYTFPFIYMAQAKNATHLYTVPLEYLGSVLLGTSTFTKEFTFNRQNTSLENDSQVLFLFSTGRCGSTLLCKVLDRIDGVLGLQEPDPFTLLTVLRTGGGASDEDIVILLRLALLAHCKPKIHHPGQVNKWVFKFQSQVSEYMDLFPVAFPNSHNLFMYRNADAVTKSIARMIPNLNNPLNPIEVWQGLWPGLKWLPGDSQTEKEVAMVFWLTTMTKAQKFKNAGMKLPCVRYEELVADTEKTVRALAKLFAIELKDENIPRVLDAMKGHSQEGIFTVTEHKELPEVLATMRKLVTEYTSIGSVDYILPDTVLKSTQ